jgi:hypothetical protein
LGLDEIAERTEMLADELRRQLAEIPSVIVRDSGASGAAS